MAFDAASLVGSAPGSLAPSEPAPTEANSWTCLWALKIPRLILNGYYIPEYLPSRSSLIRAPAVVLKYIKAGWQTCTRAPSGATSQPRKRLFNRYSCTAYSGRALEPLRSAEPSAESI